jgi:hypothetical protein
MVWMPQTDMRRMKTDDVNRAPLHLALREIRDALSSPRALTGMAAAVIVLGVSGPFDTLTQLDMPRRLLYWLVIVVLSYLGSRAVVRMVLAMLHGRLDGLAPRIAVATLASSVPSWLVVYGVTLVAAGGERIDPLKLWFYCLIVGLAMVTLNVVSAQTAPAPATLPETPATPPPILQRLPLPQRGQLLHLAVSDHYVDVVTDKGHGLVLMRLGDAMSEATPVRGLQVHRSHWVALKAVRRATRQSGKPALELVNGTVVPVSRSFAAAARQAGLLR